MRPLKLVKRNGRSWNAKVLSSVTPHNALIAKTESLNYIHMRQNFVVGNHFTETH